MAFLRHKNWWRNLCIMWSIYVHFFQTFFASTVIIQETFIFCMYNHRGPTKSDFRYRYIATKISYRPGIPSTILYYRSRKYARINIRGPTRYRYTAGRYDLSRNPYKNSDTENRYTKTLTFAMIHQQKCYFVFSKFSPWKHQNKLVVVVVCWCRWFIK